MYRSLLLVILLAGLAAFSMQSISMAEQRGRSRWEVLPEIEPLSEFDHNVDDHSNRMRREGRRIFRFDTFGSEAFWGDKLRLHHAIAGVRFGGVGPGLSPATALALGLKVDVEEVPPEVVDALRAGALNLSDPANTLVLLAADAIVGVKAIRAAGSGVTSVGIQCALCHSTVDNSFMPGVGRRLDGWPNRDLNVGAIIALAPDLSPFTQLLQIDDATARRVFNSWGPGRFDAELILDGKAFRPDGRTAATLMPAAFGLAGVSLHTYTGWGSVTHWNAFVSNLEMMGSGTFFDPRLNDAERFPVAVRGGLFNVRKTPDLITSKLAALHYYQLSIPPPTAPPGSFDPRLAEGGAHVFNGRARCGTCHVPPLFTEPGWPMHTAAEIGIDDFQANRSPDRRYRTTPLGGLFTRQKGGFYHDGRFPTLEAVVEHYDRHLSLRLSNQERAELIEYLKSL